MESKLVNLIVRRLTGNQTYVLLIEPVWNRNLYFAWTLELWGIVAFNRTSMESKQHFHDDVECLYQKTFNRTSMESKPVWLQTLYASYTFNRTSMESKLVRKSGLPFNRTSWSRTYQLLIEPVWNRNEFKDNRRHALRLHTFNRTSMESKPKWETACQGS